jgi:hypothetical protein
MPMSARRARPAFQKVTAAMAPDTHIDDDVKDLDGYEQPADAGPSVPATAPAPEMLGQLDSKALNEVLL